MAILTKNRGRFCENLSRIYFRTKKEEIQYLFSRKFTQIQVLRENARKFVRAKISTNNGVYLKTCGAAGGSLNAEVKWRKEAGESIFHDWGVSKG